MNLSFADVARYDHDGYLLVENVFSEREVAAMLKDVEGGSRVSGAAGGLADAGGTTAKMALWTNIADDIWGAASTHPHIVNTVRILMREDIAFYHGKVMLKEARSGGAWEWHQDYGYWYDGGFVFPRMMSAFVALDRSTQENGCLQVLKGSHLLGRLDHGKVGGQAGVDEARIAAIEPHFERVHVEMSPGSVLFFHCNLLHTSAANTSDYPRRSFIMCYNGLDNPQFGKPEMVETGPCPVGSPDTILKFA